MSDDFLVDVAELNTLSHDLAGAPKRVLEDSSKVLLKGINDVVADAQRFVPVDTGATRNSIHAAATGSNRAPIVGDLDVEAGPTTEYAPDLEYGTANSAPRAFMGPAFDLHAHEVVEGLQEAASRRVLP